jgi:tRNA pseudouridine55 synthase
MVTNQPVIPEFIVDKVQYLKRGIGVLEELNSTEGSLLLIDKPYGLTSYAIVHRVRKILTFFSKDKWVKVGHGGTLDPLATGLLIIGTRRTTKYLHHLLAERKTYRVTFRLGITSPSFDLETPISVISDLASLQVSIVEEKVKALKGSHDQLPPQFSAVKHKGKPLYKHARKGRIIDIAPKSVTIYAVENIYIDLPHISFDVECSRGTYIRALARDIGEKLSAGAVVTALRRTKIGDWNVSDALSVELIDELRSVVEEENIGAIIS